MIAHALNPVKRANSITPYTVTDSSYSDVRSPAGSDNPPVFSFAPGFFTIQTCQIHTVAAACNARCSKPENPAAPGANEFFADTPASGEHIIAVAGTESITEYAFFSNDSHLATAPCRYLFGNTGPNSHIQQTYGSSDVR